MNGENVRDLKRGDRGLMQVLSRYILGSTEENKDKISVTGSTRQILG
jgi:hypothetical protein